MENVPYSLHSWVWIHFFILCIHSRSSDIICRCYAESWSWSSNCWNQSGTMRYLSILIINFLLDSSREGPSDKSESTRLFNWDNTISLNRPCIFLAGSFALLVMINIATCLVTWPGLVWRSYIWEESAGAPDSKMLLCPSCYWSSLGCGQTGILHVEMPKKSSQKLLGQWHNKFWALHTYLMDSSFGLVGLKF
jgi:hypothetical protein